MNLTASVRASRPWVATVVRVGLAALWIYAGLSKIGDPLASLRAVRAYDLFPEWLAKTVGYGLPFVEIGLGLLLLAGLVTRFAASVSAFLLAVFVAGIASAWARGLSIECGCFGDGGTVAEGDTAYTGEILRDVGLLVLSVGLALWPASRFSADERIERAAHPDARSTRVGRKHTKEAQKRLEALQELSRWRARARLRLVAASAAAVLVVLGAAGIGIQNERVGITGSVPTPEIAVGENGTGGLAFGPADAEVVVDVYEDLMCPVCQQLHLASGDKLKELAETGTAQVRYHTVAYLDDRSTSDYSTRAAAALGCAADGGAFHSLLDVLFRNQPEEGTDGLSNGQLLELGRNLVSDTSAFFDCVENGTYEDWVTVTTEEASKSGITGVPTVLVNGERVTGADGAVPGPNDIAEAVTAAGT